VTRRSGARLMVSHEQPSGELHRPSRVLGFPQYAPPQAGVAYCAQGPPAPVAALSSVAPPNQPAVSGQPMTAAAPSMEASILNQCRPCEASGPLLLMVAVAGASNAVPEPPTENAPAMALANQPVLAAAEVCSGDGGQPPAKRSRKGFSRASAACRACSVRKLRCRVNSLPFWCDNCISRGIVCEPQANRKRSLSQHRFQYVIPGDIPGYPPTGVVNPWPTPGTVPATQPAYYTSGYLPTAPAALASSHIPAVSGPFPPSIVPGIPAPPQPGGVSPGPPPPLITGGTKYCIHGGPKCGAVPEFARFCPTCGMAQTH